MRKREVEMRDSDSKSKGRGDMVINHLLDQLLEMTGFDPSSMLPEHHVRRDYNLNKLQARSLVQRVLGSLQMERQLVQGQQDFSDFTLREIVDWVNDLQSKKLKAA